MSERRQNISYVMHLRHAYSVEEDIKILEYVQQARKYGDLTKNDFWMELQDKKLLPNRSWESMRQRYFKNVRYKSLRQLKDAQSPKHSDDEDSESEEDLSEIKREQVKHLNEAIMDSNCMNNSSYEEDCSSEDHDSKREILLSSKRSKVSTQVKTDSKELNNSENDNNDSEELFPAEIPKQKESNKNKRSEETDSSYKKDSSSEESSTTSKESSNSSKESSNSSKESSNSSEESYSSSDHESGSKREEIFLRSKASKVSNQISTDYKQHSTKVNQSENEDSDSEKESLSDIQKRINLKRPRKAMLNKCSKEDHSSKSKAKYSHSKSRSSNRTTAETELDSEGNSSSPKVKGDYIYFKRSKLSKLLALTDSEEESSSELKGKYIYFKRSELLKLAKTGNKLDSGEDGNSDVKRKGIYPKRSKLSKLETTDGESDSEGGNLNNEQKICGSKTSKLSKRAITDNKSDSEEDSSLKRKTTLTPSKKHKTTTNKPHNNDPVNDTNWDKEGVEHLSTLAEEGIQSLSLDADTVSPAKLANDDTFPPHLLLLTSQDGDDRSDDEMSEVFDVIDDCKEIEQAEMEINNNGDSLHIENTGSTSLDNEKKVVKNNKAKELMEVEGTSALTPDQIMQIENYLMKQMKEDGSSNDEQEEVKLPKCPNKGNSQWVVLKKILRVRSRTQATLPLVFFSLFKTSGNVHHAIAFLNDKDNKHVWSKKDDKVLMSKDKECTKEIIAKHGLQAVRERVKFLELDGCTVVLNS